MKKIQDYCLQELLNVDMLCNCGKRHKAEFPKVYFADIYNLIKQLLAAGHIAFISTEGMPENFLDKIEEDAKHTHCISRIKLLPFDNKIGEILPEDVRLIVAYGDEKVMNISKRLALEMGVKLILVPLLAYRSIWNDKCIFQVNGVREEKKGRKADAIFIEYESLLKVESDYLINAFSAMLASLLDIVDYKYKTHMIGELACEDIIEGIKRQVAVLLKYGVFTPCGTRLLADSYIKVSILEELVGIESGVGQLACSIDKYLQSRTRDKRSEGENALIGSIITTTLYETFLREDEKLLSLPPNRGIDSEQLRRLLRVREAYSMKNARSYSDNSALVEHKYFAVRRELLEDVRLANLMLKEGYELIKRAYKDNGFFMQEYLSIEEIFKIIPISTEFVPKDTLLNYIKDTGALEGLKIV